MNRKTFALAEVKVLDSESETGEFEVILSAPTLDRDGEIIDAKAFEPLPDHITFDIDHGLSTATTVGSGTPRYEDDLLIVKGTFSSIPRAQEVRTLVAEGHIRTTSVAFMDAKRTVKDGVTHIERAELLNGAFVPVPSNREAAVLVAKSFATQAEKETEAAAKSLSGSYEQRRDDLRQAISTANPDAWWVTILATFDDNVVYDLGNNEQFRATYSYDDAGTLSLGSAEEVVIEEVVTPKSAESILTAEAAALATAEAAKTPADVQVALARLTAMGVEAEALLSA
jgi:phage head maturation protease